MTRWTTADTTTNRTCPLRRILAVTTPAPSVNAAWAGSWQDEALECGHTNTDYKGRAKVGQRRRCTRCRDESQP